MKGGFKYPMDPMDYFHFRDCMISTRQDDLPCHYWGFLVLTCGTGPTRKKLLNTQHRDIDLKTVSSVVDVYIHICLMFIFLYVWSRGWDYSCLVKIEHMNNLWINISLYIGIHMHDNLNTYFIVHIGSNKYIYIYIYMSIYTSKSIQACKNNMFIWKYIYIYIHIYIYLNIYIYKYIHIYTETTLQKKQINPFKELCIISLHSMGNTLIQGP